MTRLEVQIEKVQTEERTLRYLRDRVVETLIRTGENSHVFRPPDSCRSYELRLSQRELTVLEHYHRPGHSEIQGTRVVKDIETLVEIFRYLLQQVPC